jgi:predicted nuclease of restriction endonuclease-like (RecB) superfamily
MATTMSELPSQLAQRLTKRFGRGMGVATLRRGRAFYQTYPQGSAIPPELGGVQIRSTALIELDGETNRSTMSIESSGFTVARFPPMLGGSHYLVLLHVPRPEARSFYEIEAARESWSVRELERQVASLLFERLAMNKNPERVLTLARQGQQISVPGDVLKNPFVLEFADLRENPIAQERDLEQAIIDRLEDFLLEMGKGFCFVARLLIRSMERN